MWTVRAALLVLALATALDAFELQPGVDFSGDSSLVKRSGRYQSLWRDLPFQYETLYEPRQFGGFKRSPLPTISRDRANAYFRLG